jgi:hypothetical protein
MFCSKSDRWLNKKALKKEQKDLKTGEKASPRTP